MDRTERNDLRRHYVIISFVIYFCYISYGLTYNIWGPAWVDLVSLLDSTQDAMAYGLSLMAIGYTIGAFTGGFMFNYLNRQLLLAFYLLIMAAATTLTPLLKSYTIFLILSWFFGFGEGGMDAACNAWIIEMWKDNNGPYMQALYFTFGLGSLLSPLLDMNFLKDTNESMPTKLSNNNYSETNFTIVSQYGAHHHSYIYPIKFSSLANNNNNNISNTTAIASRIYIPFSITGGFLTLSAILVVLLYIFKKYEPIVDEISDTCSVATTTTTDDSLIDTAIEAYDEDSEKSLLNPSGRHSVSPKRIIFIASIGSIMLCFYAGMENINFEYLATFTVSTKLNITPQTSALMMSALSAAYTIGRGLGIVLSIKIAPKYFIYLNFALISSAHAIMYTFADTSQTMLIIGVILLGFGFSTVVPSIYSYMEQHIRLTNFICGVFTVACASTATVDPIIIGRYIKSLPYILLYLNIVSTVLVVIAFVVFEINVFARRRRRPLLSIKNDPIGVKNST